MNGYVKKANLLSDCPYIFHETAARAIFAIFAAKRKGMNIFYTPDITGNSYTLNEEESKHCVRVLRMEIGERINLVDGDGGMYIAQIVDANPKRCRVEVVESPYIFTVNNVEGESYSCSVAQMFSEQISILGDVSDMYVYNSELFLTYKDELFMVKPLRHVYANYSSNTTTLDYGYKKLEVK